MNCIFHTQNKPNKGLKTIQYQSVLIPTYFCLESIDNTITHRVAVGIQLFWELYFIQIPIGCTIHYSCIYVYSLLYFSIDACTHCRKKKKRRVCDLGGPHTPARHHVRGLN